MEADIQTSANRLGDNNVKLLFQLNDLLKCSCLCFNIIHIAFPEMGDFFYKGGTND